MVTYFAFWTVWFVWRLTLYYFVLVFFCPFSITITSLREERANLSAFRTFVRLALVWCCRFPLPLGVWEGLRFVTVALPGPFSYLFPYVIMSRETQLCRDAVFPKILHVRSESSLSVGRPFRSFAGQRVPTPTLISVPMRRLTWVFAGRTCNLAHSYSLIRIFIWRIMDSQGCNIYLVRPERLWSDCADAHHDFSLR